MSTRPKTNNITLSTSDTEPPVIITDAEGNIVEYTDYRGFHAIRYRDEYVGGDWVVPQGAAAPDPVNITIGGVEMRLLGFDGNNQEERKNNHFENAHDLALELVNEGILKIEFHVHAIPSSNNAGVVKWNFNWAYLPAPDNGTPKAPVVVAPVSILMDIQANTLTYQYVKGAELPIPEGGFHIGDIISFSLSRNPNDVEDTYPDDILLLKAALHVPTDGDGSRQRYIK
jgi:hypothetical protein